MILSCLKCSFLVLKIKITMAKSISYEVLGEEMRLLSEEEISAVKKFFGKSNFTKVRGKDVSALEWLVFRWDGKEQYVIGMIRSHDKIYIQNECGWWETEY